MQQNIGIDLGTCNSCVAEFKNDSAVALINNISKQLTTPSYITFPNQAIGLSEKVNPTTNQTISSFKRLIGRRFDDKEVQEQIKRVDYQIINKNNQPMIQVAPDTLLSATQVSGHFLKQLKNVTGFSSDRLVVTVPAYFSHSQKLETENAGKLAGLQISRLLAEPTAAALQYNQQLKNFGLNEYIMVVDLGAGTFDVSILEKQQDVYTVLACAGNNYYGGDDYTNALRQVVAEKYNQTLSFGDAEGLKHKLSQQQSVLLSNNQKLELKDVQQVFSLLDKKLEKPILQTLSDSQLNQKQISKVLLVGGQTKQPSIQKKIQQITGIKPSTTLNPDLCVAQGASIQSAVLNQQLNSVLLLDATPFSLGIETLGGIYSKIINRNVTLPAKQSQIFTTTEDDQRSVIIRIYQGENNLVLQNIFLNEFVLEIEPKQPKGTPKIRVEFEIDQNGIVSVSAVDEKTGNKKEVKIRFGSEGAPEKSEYEALKEYLQQQNVKLDGKETIEKLRLLKNKIINQHKKSNKQQK